MKHTVASSIGLLILRIGIGGMLIFGHGWMKLTRFSQLADGFPNPLGLGSEFTLGLAIFAEVLCALLIVVGLGTQFAAIPILLTMIVAAFVFHANDPFQQKELALMYAVPMLTLIFTGPGRIALDALIKIKKR